MTTNDEKLWEEIENCLEYDNDYYDESVFLHATSIENLMNWFKNKETDLLKQFVERYKSRLTFIQEHEKELLDDDVKHEYSHLVEYRKGTIDMLDRLLYHIDGDLEEFLESDK